MEITLPLCIYSTTHQPFDEGKYDSERVARRQEKRETEEQSEMIMMTKTNK